jgi:hypothetical protein
MMTATPPPGGGNDTTSTAAAGWNNRSGWLDYDVSECNWHGCACNTTDGSTTLLALEANNLAGRLSSPAFELVLMRERMVEVVLIHNALSGIIPIEFALLSGLETVWLDGNSFSGSIPPGLGNLTSLGVLAMRGIQSRTGSIPTDLGRLSHHHLLETKRWFCRSPVLSLADLGQLRANCTSQRSGPIVPKGRRWG